MKVRLFATDRMHRPPDVDCRPLTTDHRPLIITNHQPHPPTDRRPPTDPLHQHEAKPMYVDITWGAGGTTADATMDITLTAKRDFGLIPNMHLTLVILICRVMLAVCPWCSCLVFGVWCLVGCVRRRDVN